MLVNYKKNGQNTTEEFKSVTIRIDKKGTFFTPGISSLIGTTTSGEVIVLKEKLPEGKVDKIYRRIQRQLSNPFWMGGVINV